MRGYVPVDVCVRHCVVREYECVCARVYDRENVPLCVCVCMCVCARVRAYESVNVCVHLRQCQCVCAGTSASAR